MSYADRRTNPLVFKVGDHVYLKVSPWKGVQRFGVKGKLAPRYIGPYPIVERLWSCSISVESSSKVFGNS